MEKQGKIKIVKYNDEETISTKHCIITNDTNEIQIAYVISYDEVMLVRPQNMPQWILNKIRIGKVKHNDMVIVTVNNNGTTYIENEEAILEIPKIWSHKIDDLFEEKYNSEEVKNILVEYTDRLNYLFYSNLSVQEKTEMRDKILAEFYVKYNLKNINHE